MPLFEDAADSCEAPFSAVAEWLAANIYDEVYPSGTNVAGWVFRCRSGPGNVVSLFAPCMLLCKCISPAESMVGSPRKGDPYNSLPLAGIVQGERQLAAPIEETVLQSEACLFGLPGFPPINHSVSPAGGIVDIQGVCKSTVVRGEDDFPSGTLRVTDCHDTIIYALAPLQ